MINRVCSLLCLPLIFSIYSESCLDGTTERLISGSRFRVQDQFFEADSYFNLKHSPQQARLDGKAWCSGQSSGRHWLQVTFGMDVNISIIQTNSRYFNYYLTKFEVHVGDGTEGNIHPLTISDDSSEPMVFVRSLMYNLENTTLPSPVTTQVLRIVPVEWIPMNSVPCLRLEALGCPASQVCGTEQLLTNDAELLNYIIGSSSIPSGSPINDLVAISGIRWCTARNLGSNPYFQLNFTSMVSLTYMKARGIHEGYVSEFSLEVQDESGNFNSYGITSKPTNFTASGANLELFTFWKPIQGNTFRLHILNFFRIKNLLVCWNIGLYGCIINTAPPTFSITATEADIDASTYSRQGQSRAAIVGGAVVGSLGLLVILCLLAIVVVTILIFTRRKSAQVQLPESCEDSAGHNFVNSIYEQQTTINSLYKDTAEHSFDNGICGDEPALPHLYEVVPESASVADRSKNLRNFEKTLTPSSRLYAVLEPSPNRITTADREQELTGEQHVNLD